MDAAAYSVVRGWAGTGWTTEENLRAFQRWVFLPQVLVNVERVSTSTTVLGTPIDVPVMLAPTASHKLAHRDGELAAARAALRVNTIQVLSTYASTSLEDVARVGPSRWLQLYWFTDWALTRELIERAAAAGYSAIVLTVDAAADAWRDELLRHPFVLPRVIHEPNTHDRLLQIDPTLTWHSLERLRSVSALPLVLKGVIHPRDARLAVDAGVAAIVVSNHGGRQLDGCVASLDALGDVLEAVDGRLEVLMDGGVRRGTDVLKALALGARAVLLGRSIQWALATGGEAGILRLFELITGELRSAMALCGCPSVQGISPAIVRPNDRPWPATRANATGRP
jgi:4-hydroxymandelate oxidase